MSFVLSSLARCKRPAGHALRDQCALRVRAKRHVAQQHRAGQARIRSERSAATHAGGEQQQRPVLRRIPRITYSSDWRTVDLDDLEQLLDAVQPARSAQSPRDTGKLGALFQQQFGILPADEAALDREGRRQKLAKALSSTMCFVGAFARADSLPGYQDAPEPEGMSEEQSWEWAKQRRKRGRQKRLVGYARASGDSTLVSTLYDVAVHPDLHGLGLGKRLIRRVCQSVFGLSIGDVAVMAPEHLEGFFEECSFGPDQVCESYLMAYPMDPGTEQLDPASHLRRDSLTTLMQRRLRSC